MLAALALGAVEAQALQCGKTISKSVKLKADLVNCPGSGLTTGKAGITIDLNGHQVDGVKAINSDGIAVLGHDDVTIKGPGRITGFETGVLSLVNDHLVMRGVKVKNHDETGIQANGTTNARIKNGKVLNSPSGIILSGGADPRVARNELRGSNMLNGIAVEGTDDAKVKRNNLRVITGAGIGVGLRVESNADTARLVKNSIVGASSQGIRVWDGAESTRVRENVSRRHGGSGIWVANNANPGTRLIDNRAHRNSTHGIEIDLIGVEVGGNRANDNDQWGIFGPDPGTIDLGGNVASGNGAGPCMGVSC